MSELTQLGEEVAAEAQKILQSHIDSLNAQYAKAVDELGQEATRFRTFNRRSTWLIWAMFWVSGFLGRGMFREGPMEWSLAAVCTGFALGMCTYFAIFGPMRKG